MLNITRSVLHMKFTKISSVFRDRRGEVGTVAIIIGMVIIGLGILLGSQVRNQNINIAPRAAESTDPLWAQAKPSAVTGRTLWSGGGPTSGWESYYANRVYICNGNTCWIIEGTTPRQFANGGVPIE